MNIFQFRVKNVDILFFQETWQRNNDNFNIKVYESLLVPRKESLKSRCGYGDISLFFHKEPGKGIKGSEIDLSGILWVKFCKTFFPVASRFVYMFFLYFPPNNSVYYNVHELTFFFETLQLRVRNYLDIGSVTINILRFKCMLWK